MANQEFPKRSVKKQAKRILFYTRNVNSLPPLWSKAGFGGVKRTVNREEATACSPEAEPCLPGLGGFFLGHSGKPDREEGVGLIPVNLQAASVHQPTGLMCRGG